MSTDDFRKLAEEISGQSLQCFFLQWIESSGAPEFKLEYTVFRTQKGFRVMGKISQDLDTFRMPVDLQIETEGNPEDKRIEVVGTSSEFAMDTFGKPKTVTIDPNGRCCASSPPCAWRWPSGAASSSPRSASSASAEGISEGAGGESRQFAGALPRGARCSSCRTTINPPPTNSAKG